MLHHLPHCEGALRRGLRQGALCGPVAREVEDYYLNFYVRRPEYLEALPEAERLAISNSLSGMRQYSEMPLKILKAEELVGARRPWMRSCTASSTGSWTPCTPI